MGCNVVGSRSWEFVLGSFAPAKNSSKVSDATVLVPGVEVLAIFIESKGGGILSWPRNSHLFFVGVFDFS